MNKKGWGLRAELGFLLLFLICILVATIGLQKMGILGSGDSDLYSSSSNKKYDYNALENKVVEAAQKYYSNTYPNGAYDTVIVSVDTLKNNGYLTPLYDYLGRECRGYAKILKNKTCVSYIRCGFYKTTGYSEDYE